MSFLHVLYETIGRPTMQASVTSPVRVILLEEAVA
jgi:hypothetical protein